MCLIQKLLALLILIGSLATFPARAETFHTCGTIIASIPTVISTPGVYCLSHDVSTAVTSGNAISVNTNNVTLDCNGYKIGGLAAGTSSATNGVFADDTRQNITVRNCGIRGFREGIVLKGGAGHLIEDNRLDNNLWVGIDVSGDNNRVQRNRVYDTGGFPGYSASYGIFASADVIDNTVAGVFATATNTSPYAISINGLGVEARGNQARGLVVAGTGYANGIFVGAAGVTLRNNSIFASVPLSGAGINAHYTVGVYDTFCFGNSAANFSSGIAGCVLGSDNFSY